MGEALENMIPLEHTSQIYVISKIFGAPKILPQNAISYETKLFESLHEL